MLLREMLLLGVEELLLNVELLLLSVEPLLLGVEFPTPHISVNSRIKSMYLLLKMGYSKTVLISASLVSS